MFKARAQRTIWRGLLYGRRPCSRPCIKRFLSEALDSKKLLAASTEFPGGRGRRRIAANPEPWGRLPAPTVAVVDRAGSRLTQA
jgi:hypothetical protein